MPAKLNALSGLSGPTADALSREIRKLPGCWCRVEEGGKHGGFRLHLEYRLPNGTLEGETQSSTFQEICEWVYRHSTREDER